MLHIDVYVLSNENQPKCKNLNEISRLTYGLRSTALLKASEKNPKAVEKCTSEYFIQYDVTIRKYVVTYVSIVVLRVKCHNIVS